MAKIKLENTVNSKYGFGTTQKYTLTQLLVGIQNGAATLKTL